MQKNRIGLFIIFLFFTLLLPACSNDDIIISDTPVNVFQSFWDIMDQRYVFFEEKNINWDSIYNEYYPKMTNSASEDELTAYYTDIINYVNDDHISIIQSYASSISSFEWERDFWIDYNLLFQYYKLEEIINTDKYILGQLDNSLLYFNIKSFLLQDKDLKDMESAIASYDYSNGIVLDVRGNEGGHLEYGLKISSLFFEGEKTLFYQKCKTGYGHNDFTDFNPITMKGNGMIAENIPVVLLADKYSYSMANKFCFILKTKENCTFIGQHTGGGGGSPSYQPLPNGWVFAYTRFKSYSTKYELMENGLDPDIAVVPDSTFWHEEHDQTGRDLQFEAALDYLLK